MLMKNVVNQQPRGVIVIIYLTKPKNLFRKEKPTGGGGGGGGLKKEKKNQSSIRTPPPSGRQPTTTAETHVAEYAEISASSRDTQPSTPRRTSRALTAALMGFFRRAVTSSVNDNTAIFLCHITRALMGVMPQISHRQQAGCCTLLPSKRGRLRRNEDRDVWPEKQREIKSRVGRRADSQVKAARARFQLQGPERFGSVLPLRPCRSGAALRLKKGK